MKKAVYFSIIFLLFISIWTIGVSSKQQTSTKMTVQESIEIDGLKVRQDFMESIMEFSDVIPEDSLYIPDWLN